MDINHKIITLLNDNQKYFVLEQLSEDNKDYCLILNVDNENDIKIVEKVIDGIKTGFADVTDKELISRLSIKFKSAIEKIVEMYA